MTNPMNFEQLTAQAAALDIRNKAFINGAYVDAASGKTFDCISPRDGSVLTKVEVKKKRKLMNKKRTV